MKPTDTLPFKRVAHTIEYLYDHFREQPELEDIAKHVHISPLYLQRQFQTWAGISPKKMLQYISIENAKRILQQQGSIQAAAWNSGLSGGGRLHDLFITIEGMTPSEYKNGGAHLHIDYAFKPTLLGEVLIAATSKGICWLAFVDEREHAVQELMAEFPQAAFTAQPHPLHEQALMGLQAPTPIPLHLKGTPFQLKVWQALLHIPEGCLSSYGQIATMIGQAQSARAVGNAVGQNPVALLIPCHRVIRESGVISGYRWQRGRKMALLAMELHKHVE